MSQSPSPLSRGPTWLVFFLLVVAPPATLTFFLQEKTHDPWLTGGLIVAYEILLTLGAVISRFIGKIWQPVEDSWASEIGQQLNSWRRGRFGRYEQRYREYFFYEHRDLDMKGISTRGTYTLDLEQVFVELRIEPIPPDLASADPLRIPVELRSGSHDVWEYLIMLNQHLVILGAPGSGKTTLLKHLGLSLLMRQRKLRQRDGKQLPWTLPIFLPLREQGNALKEHPEYDLMDAVEGQIRRWRQTLPRQWIERTLQQGRCLILLDGLDEIADPTLRQTTVEWVHHQMVIFGKNRFVIASRPLGYRQNPLDRVTVLEVQPFTLEQVTQFLEVWYVANEIKRAVRDDPGVRLKAREGAEDLLQRLRATPTLFALAVNPLLLTMIATVHLYYGTLPGARVTLYKAICEVFLRRRQPDAANPHDLRAEQRQVVLQTLAYTMMRRGKLEFAHTEVCRVIEGPLQRVSTTLTSEAFLQHLETIGSGLLLERERGIYSFAHKTFLEYLAMVYIQEQHLEQELLTHIEESWWHETIQLYCAQGDATFIIQACLSRPSLSLEALALATECVQEARDVRAEIKDHFYRLLEQGVEDADPARRRVIAEALLTRRMRQMRPFQGTTYVDTSLITCAEYQLFLDEQKVQGHVYTPDHWHDAMFPAGQGQYPVLGVRAADVKAFCRWLTERDREGWIYRPPCKVEGQQESQSIRAGIPEQYAYWAEEGTLVWPRGGLPRSLAEQVTLLMTDDRGTASDRYSFLSRIRNMNRLLLDGSTGSLALKIARVLDIDISHVLDLDLTRSPDLSRVLNFDLDSASTRAHDLAETLMSAITVPGESTLIDAIELVSVLASALDNACDRALTNGHLASALTFVDARARSLVDAHTPVDTSIRSLFDARTLVIDLARVYASEILLIVHLLSERMNGSFPAYEGILLMKERPSEGGSGK